MTSGRSTALALAAAAVLAPASPGAGDRAPGPDGAGRAVPTVLEYLQAIGGRCTVAGIHNREPNSRPDLQTNRIHDLVGRYPGLWSGDFLFKGEDVNSRWAMIHECRNQWDRGSIVQLMMHVAPPNQPEVCAWEGGVLSHLSDPEWSDLTTDGGALNRAWKSRLDGYAAYLAYLRDSGVEVLFRPFHEMNQGKFWWGGRRGPGGALPARPRRPEEGEGADPPRLGLGHAGHEPRLPGLQSRERLLGHLRLRRLRGRVRPELVRLHSSDRRGEAHGDRGMRPASDGRPAGLAAAVVLLHELGRAHLHRQFEGADHGSVPVAEDSHPGAAAGLWAPRGAPRFPGGHVRTVIRLGPWPPAACRPRGGLARSL